MTKLEEKQMSRADSPYARFDEGQLILRDELALDRTALANERTLLAYVRTALALLLAGVTFVHFSRAVWFSLVGILCLVVGMAALALGVSRYQRMRSALIALRKQARAASTAGAEEGDQHHASGV